ncbi:MAG: hypothetical protein C4539_14555 [Ignavibacteriales bacterium]|nr:MAG: hypothetical protein C4539_14555 [Ignavibacteriales bacterium]
MITSNLKDKLTTYAAIAMGAAVATVGLPAAVTAIAPTVTFTLPPIVNVICGIVIAISIIVTQVLTGKAPDGKTKTTEQVIEGNTK